MEQSQNNSKLDITGESISTENEEGKSNADDGQESDKLEPDLEINIDDVAIDTNTKAKAESAASAANNRKNVASSSVERVATNTDQINLNGLLANEDEK